ncbi:phage tail tube protein [bacterium]|nr:phage tail tube protein [bacterium]
MSGFTNRYVGLVKESAYGTDPGSAYVYGEVDDESIKHNYDVLQRTDMSRYGAAKSNTGKEYSEGDINMAMLADNFTGLALTGLFPTDTVGSVADGLYPHVYTEAGTDRSFTMKVGREEKEHTYTGIVVDSLSISANLNEYAMVSASFMGKAESAVATLATPSFNTNDALYFSDAKVFFNGDATASNLVKSISFDINMNRDGDNACGLGDATYIRAPPFQRREISGTIEFNKIIHTAVESEPTYTELTAADGLELSGSGIELKVQFGDESVADVLTFNFYKIRFEAPDANVSGRDTQTMTVPFVALFSPNDSKMMDITLRNAQSSAY